MSMIVYSDQNCIVRVEQNANGETFVTVEALRSFVDAITGVEREDNDHVVVFASQPEDMQAWDRGVPTHEPLS